MQSYMTDDGILLVIPNTYVSIKVQSSTSNSPTAGIVTIIGEANAGPDFSLEDDLDVNLYDPSELAEVIAKYESGNIVDGFRGLSSAANDDAIIGGVQGVKIVKTNPSLKAAATLSRSGVSYGLIASRQYGVGGNLIRYKIANDVAETAPQTAAFSYCPHFEASPYTGKFRTNGNDAVSMSVASALMLEDLYSAIEANAIAQGLGFGFTLPSEYALTSGVTLTLAVVDTSNITLTIGSGSWVGSPAVGDTIVIPATATFGLGATHSIVTNSSTVNIGSYIITNATASVLSCKLINKPSAMTLSGQSGSSTGKDLVIYKQSYLYNFTGMNRKVAHGISGSFSSVIGSNIVLTSPTAWTVQPVVGDYFSLSAVFAGIAKGFYRVTASSSATVTLSKLAPNDALGTSGTTVVAVPIDDSNQPFIISKPAIDGLGKSLELSGSLGSIFKLASGAALTNVNQLTDSSNELSVISTYVKDSTTDEIVAGGSIVLSVGCTQDDATMVISNTTILFKVSGSTIFSTPFATFKTLKDVVDFVNTQTTFSATLISPRYSALVPTVLDKGTFGISSDIGEEPGLIKKDAYDFNLQNNSMSLVTFTIASNSTSGLPESMSAYQFLTGGAKGGTTAAQIIAAIDACENIDTNFIVPCFSQDASADILEDLTDISSTYTIDNINTYLKSHVIKMSTVERRSNRIAIESKNDTYENQKDASAVQNSFRVGMAFQPISFNNTPYQPWMTAIIAAGMQAAAGYKGIVKKFANISALASRSDFNPKNPGNVKDALKSGLLILEKVKTGGFRWVSDQMTYSNDNNFVYNSLQAVYLADLMASSLMVTFDRAVVGKSIAEMSAVGARTLLEAAMGDFMRLHWISPSDDAPSGYKDASVKLQGKVMNISLNCKLAGLIYFVPINFTVSEVTQTA